jgi:hypothetical protein
VVDSTSPKETFMGMKPAVADYSDKFRRVVGILTRFGVRCGGSRARELKLWFKSH